MLRGSYYLGDRPARAPFGLPCRAPPPVSISSSAPAPAAAGETPEGTPAPTDPVEEFYRRADALYRCAAECCRQHERVADLDRRGSTAAEQRAARALAALCNDALDELTGSYERGAAKAPRVAARGAGTGDAGWHAANGLWLASRELTRRRRTSARAGRGIGERGDRSSARLAELALDYDLEASALLLLKQATDAYRRARPDAA